MGQPVFRTQAVPCPPAPTVPIVPFLKVRPGQPLIVAFASQQAWSCYTHFDGQRTLYCPGGEWGPCDRSCPPRKPRWMSYAVVLFGQHRALRILSWAAAAQRHCPDLGELSGQLRGLGVKLARLGRSPNSALRIELTGELCPGPLPEVLDVRAYLSRLWDVNL